MCHKTLFRLCLSVALLNLSYFCPAQNHGNLPPAPGSQTPAQELAGRQEFAEAALRLGLKGEYAQALEILDRARLAAEKNADKAGGAMVIIDSTLIYFFQGNNLKALATYQKMPPIAEIEADRKALAHVLSRRAFLGYYRNGFAQALKDVRRSLALLDPAADKIETGFALNVLGMIESATGNPQEALKALQESIAICRQLADEFWLALPLNNLGYVYHTQDNQTLALNYYQQSLALIERFGMRALLHYTLNNIGTAHLSEGAYTQALPYFHRSLAERQTNGKADEISTTLRDLGSAYRDMGDYASAQDYYGRSLAIEEKLQNASKVAGRLLNIGFVYVCQQNFGLGFVYFQRSLAVAEASDDKEGTARAYTSIGDLHLFQGSYDLALDYYQKAAPVAAASGHKALINSILQSIGTAYREKGDYPRALSYYQDYFKSPEVSASKTMQASLLLNIGLTYHLQGDYDKALTYYQEFMELNGQPGNRQLLCIALGLRSAVYQARGDSSRALSLAEEGYALARQLQNYHAIAYARLITGRAFHSLRQLEKARQAYDEAIAATENIRSQIIGSEQEQQRFFEKRLTPYHEIIALLIEQNKTDEAFAYAERAKARTLLDVLQSGKLNITKSMTASEQLQEQGLRNELFSVNSQILKESLRQKPHPTRLSELNERVQKARFNYEAFQMNLYVTHAELQGKRGEAQPLKLQESGALLEDAKSLLLEYVVTQDRTYLFAISKSASPGRNKIDVKVYAIAVTGKALSTAAEEFRKQLASRDIGFRQAARRLYDLLVRPAQNELQGKNHVVIVPDGALWELPFQALQAAADRYLIEDAAISYAPSLSALREMRKQRRTYGESATLLAFGNPALSNETLERNRIARRDEKLEPLPEAEKEVKELAQLYGAENSRIYIGAAAREDLLKAEAGKFKVLHIAAHGILNDANPLYSRLVLAQGMTREDGLLEAWEIMKLELRADLVVLSACNTARGRIGAGEGVIGLTWALFVAGSPTTVVSQWKVDSASTSLLMTDFHRNLKNIKATTSKAEALRAASLKMLQSSQYRHPFYWAGFVVIGNGF